MGGITGATSGKFVLMAATLLFHGRVDNARTLIAIVPGAPHSAIGATLADRIVHRDRVKIGIRADRSIRIDRKERLIRGGLDA